MKVSKWTGAAKPQILVKLVALILISAKVHAEITITEKTRNLDLLINMDQWTTPLNLENQKTHNKVCFNTQIRTDDSNCFHQKTNLRRRIENEPFWLNVLGRRQTTFIFLFFSRENPNDWKILLAVESS